MKHILITFSLFSFLFIVTAVINATKTSDYKKVGNHINQGCKTGSSITGTKIIS
jgi:hypothetical protein